MEWIGIDNSAAASQAGIMNATDRGDFPIFEGVLMNRLRTLIGAAISLAGVVVIAAGRL
ncbi:MAG: hypothetical protein V4636_20585 [Pseudomonadota bacterium]